MTEISGQSDDLIRQLQAELTASAEAQQALAEVQAEANAIERDKVSELAKLRLAEERRARNLEGIVSRYAKAGEILSGLEATIPRLNRALDYLEEQAGLGDTLRELAERVSRELEQINGTLLLLLAPDSPVKRSEVQKAEDQLKRSLTISSLNRQIIKQYENLFKLRESAAEYGTDPPLNLRNQIESIQNEIADLENQIEALDE